MWGLKKNIDLDKYLETMIMIGREKIVCLVVNHIQTNFNIGDQIFYVQSKLVKRVIKVVAQSIILYALIAY